MIQWALASVGEESSGWGGRRRFGKFSLSRDGREIDATGKVVMPGHRAHTHLVFAGSRENEFEQRIQGRSYRDRGERRGILSTVEATRHSSFDELLSLGARRWTDAFQGVTTVEQKADTDFLSR